MSTTKSTDMTSSELTPSAETSFWTPERGWHDTLVVSVRSWEEMLADSDRQGEKADPTPRMIFISYDLLHKVLAPNRMTIIRAMTGQGPMSMREVARRVGRDFKGVHSDVTALLKNGILYKMPEGQVIFPYAKIHFDFEISASDQSAA